MSKHFPKYPHNVHPALDKTMCGEYTKDVETVDDPDAATCKFCKSQIEYDREMHKINGVASEHLGVTPDEFCNVQPDKR